MEITSPDAPVLLLTNDTDANRSNSLCVPECNKCFAVLLNRRSIEVRDDSLAKVSRFADVFRVPPSFSATDDCIKPTGEELFGGEERPKGVDGLLEDREGVSHGDNSPEVGWFVGPLNGSPVA